MGHLRPRTVTCGREQVAGVSGLALGPASFLGTLGRLVPVVRAQIGHGWGFGPRYPRSPKLICMIYAKNITDMGSLIGNFDCVHSTVWKLSNLPAALILREINFG